MIPLPSNYSNLNISNKIVVLYNIPAPYEPVLIPICAKKPAAILIVVLSQGVPGQTMFLVDGINQDSINVPIAEVFVSDLNVLKIPNSGTNVTLLPQVNQWKVVNDTPTQIIFNVLLSLWEIEIMILIGWRLISFWKIEGIIVFSIAQLCLLLEFLGCALRLAYTLVDPFWTFRILVNTPSQVLFTIDFPFTLSAGILLTFYCMIYYYYYYYAG